MCTKCKNTGLQDWLNSRGEMFSRPCECKFGAIYRTIQG